MTDTTVEEWRPAHADLTWANVTGPEFYSIDWEDRGIVPRELDAATLRGHSSPSRPLWNVCGASDGRTWRAGPDG
ncbi:hypothetical protein FB570_103216 [Streptomyces sp. T12]|nr:hypothetical protein FB570_103216 [Streptomyces sp. T12]